GFTMVMPTEGEAVRNGSLILAVDGGFFSTMQVPVVRGRAIEERDERPGAPPVVVVDETYARTRFPDGHDVGRQVRLLSGPFKDLRFEIVGVATNVRVGRLTGERPPTVYFPFNPQSQDSVDGMVLQLRTAANPLGYAGTVRDIIRSANPRVP